MNPKQTLPLMAKLAPVIAVAGPPALIGAALGLTLLWLLSDKKKQAEAPQPASLPEIPASLAIAEKPKTTVRRVTQEDVATALEHGARNIVRREAVEKLQALGFKKTAAYKALAVSGRFSDRLGFHLDGTITWKG